MNDKTPDVLIEILNRKREEIIERSAKVSIEVLKGWCESSDPEIGRAHV